MIFKTSHIKILIFLTSIIFLSGILVGHYKLFPHSQLVQIKKIFFHENNLERNHEERIKLFEHFSSEVDLVFVGDSITHAGEWSDFFPEYHTANRGIWADHTEDVLKRIDSIRSLNAKYIFLMIGINDIHNGVKIMTIVNNIEHIARELSSPNNQIIIQSITQCLITDCDLDDISRTNQLNDELEKFSKKANLNFLYLEELSNPLGLEPIYSYDGIHLSVEGYKLWVKLIKEKINNINEQY
jgi:lysophospholipase L1-like esterase